MINEYIISDLSEFKITKLDIFLSVMNVKYKHILTNPKHCFDFKIQILLDCR
jgi:hypothetical protein